LAKNPNRTENPRRAADMSLSSKMQLGMSSVDTGGGKNKSWWQSFIPKDNHIIKNKSSMLYSQRKRNA